MIVIGLISGTSADGIEAAVVEFNETPASGSGAPFEWRLLKHHSSEFSPELHREILDCVRADRGTVDRICALNFELGEAFARAALDAAEAASLRRDQIDLIATHGQTVWHIPNHSTLQIGSPAVIAERTGATVISNLRARDVAAGGHGAPMVAYLDVALLTHPTLTRAAQNIGGIGNVTYIPPRTQFGRNHTETAFAFDTGPGNLLIDDAARRATGGELDYDKDGAIAARGRVDDELLAELIAHPYLRERPPKTTGREVFGAPFGQALWEKARVRGVTPQDILATVTMFTAVSIVQAYRDFLPKLPDEVIVSGGGARNPTLLRMIQSQFGDPSAPRLLLIDELGIPAQAKEAIAFALMGYETWQGRPSNVPSATGARHAVLLGDITPGDRWSGDGRR